MSPTYEQIVQQISQRYSVSPEQVIQRIQSRRIKLKGLISPSQAAHTVAMTLALTLAEHKLGLFLASGAAHVNGLTVDDALGAAVREPQSQAMFSLGYWPQAKEAPARIAEQYVQGIEGIAQAGLACSLSVKVDQLNFDANLWRPVVDAAVTHRVRLHFDAQAFDTADRTHAMMHDTQDRGAEVSGTLPARWLRSESDAERFIAMGIAIRLVKGQGGDPDHPKLDPRQAFFRLVDRLAGRATHVGVATHDRRVAEPALRRLRATETPCSLEQMRSLPRLDFLARQLELPTRVYIAYGRAGLPYAIGEVLRRPAILGWIARDLFLRHRATTTGAR
jgi:proline dehydrogenase